MAELNIDDSEQSHLNTEFGQLGFTGSQHVVYSLFCACPTKQQSPYCVQLEPGWPNYVSLRGRPWMMANHLRFKIIPCSDVVLDGYKHIYM